MIASMPPFVIIGTEAFTPAIGCSAIVSRNANDASASFLREHLFNRELGDVDEAFQVDGGESFEVLGRIVGKRLGEEYTRVID